MMEDNLTVKKRRIWLAILLHIIEPGFGHYYNGRLKRGISFFFLYETISYSLTLIAIYYESISLFALAFIISFCFWLYFMVDVIIITVNNNKIGYYTKTYNNRWYKYLIIGIGILIFYIVSDNFDNSHIFDTGKVAQISMENTILEGDIVLIKKFSLDHICNGDIVEFNSDIKPDTKHIKRCIAVGGQTVEIINGNVLVDGNPVSMPQTGRLTDTELLDYNDPEVMGYLLKKRYLPLEKIAHNFIFVLGDNRDISWDSRNIGPINRNEITGKPLFVLFSTGEKYDKNANIFKRAIAAFSHVRWNRIGLKLE